MTYFRMKSVMTFTEIWIPHILLFTTYGDLIDMIFMIFMILINLH